MMLFKAVRLRNMLLFSAIYQVDSQNACRATLQYLASSGSVSLQTTLYSSQNGSHQENSDLTLNYSTELQFHFFMHLLPSPPNMTLYLLLQHQRRICSWKSCNLLLLLLQIPRCPGVKEAMEDIMSSTPILHRFMFGSMWASVMPLFLNWHTWNRISTPSLWTICMPL
jgi:hypothetical protein